MPIPTEFIEPMLEGLRSRHWCFALVKLSGPDGRIAIEEIQAEAKNRGIRLGDLMCNFIQDDGIGEYVVYDSDHINASEILGVVKAYNRAS
jgi:hypothetical protein